MSGLESKNIEINKKIIYMKRFGIFIVMALMAVMASAKDVILLTNGATIRAKVVACSSTEVQYFNLDIPNGPIFTLFNREIALVELNNGQTHYYSPMNMDLTRLSHNQVFRFTPRNYFHDGRFYHRSQMEEMLRNTCDAAYKTYKNGKKLNAAGWGLLAGGIALDATGICLMAYGPHGHPGFVTLTGGIMLEVGTTAIVASIPTLLIGRYKINNAYKKYNKQNLTLNLALNSTGVGVALAF